MAGSATKVVAALFGLGRIGQVHLPNLLANSRVDLKWVVEFNPDVAKATLKTHGAIERVKVAGLEDIETVLKDKSVQAVFVCTPTDTHVELTLRALRAGKHVFCEKPISEDTSKIIQCYDVAEECNQILMAAFNRKFDVSYREVYNKVRSGALGDLYMVRSTMRDKPLWMGAESLTQTFLCHEIDQLCWMADDLPESVVTIGAANIKEIKEKGDLDNVVVTMKFPSGTIGVLDFCRCSCYGYDIRLEVFGSKGMLKIDCPTINSVHSYTESGHVDPPINITFSDRFAGAYINEVNHFIDVIQGKAEMMVPRIQCVRVGLVLDAIKESYEKGKIVYLKK